MDVPRTSRILFTNMRWYEFPERCITESLFYICLSSLPCLFRLFIYKQELKFWRVRETDISMCCWSKYDSSRATTKMFEELDKLFDDGTSSVTSFSIGAKVGHSL